MARSTNGVETGAFAVGCLGAMSGVPPPGGNFLARQSTSS
eukprot:CAMPEP_0194538620 /NCGR_PEP_ID=MMETSP0253-20130528/78213_1 /TAXON_ID=2966 /ORGANISM="Noctiluca scintillans" /LENGTH=39 /DNA_ID= /DNA_START= /DNA_END= /DNA_ORIENTATION=